MKIDESLKAGLVQTQVEDKGAAKSDGSFNHVLEEELSRGEGTNEAEGLGLESTSLSSLDHISILDILGKIPNLTNDMGTEIREISDCLNGVEQMLSSGSVSTKQLGDAIDTLSKEAEKLQDVTRSLPSDHPLRQISGELSLLAHVETMKWKRGDYV